MAKQDSSHSETTADSSSEEPESPGNAQNADISAYENQRLSRIAENKARMEALGLTKISSSLMGSNQKVDKRSGKRKMMKDADEDYRPNDEDNDDEDEDFVGSGNCGSRQKKVKDKSPKSKTKVKNPLNNSVYVDEDDELQQAIALSLKESTDVLYAKCTWSPQGSERHAKDGILNERNDNSHVHEDTRKKKKMKSLFTRRVQMTEDELAVHFCQFDEGGKGSISVRDLRKIAVAHDFSWTDKEISDMIYCFDSNDDGKLSFDDFRKIVGRCNMIQQGIGNC